MEHEVTYFKYMGEGSKLRDELLVYSPYSQVTL